MKGPDVPQSATRLRSVSDREAAAVRALDVYRAEIARLNARPSADLQAAVLLELSDEVSALRELVAELAEVVALLAGRDPPAPLE